MLKFGVEGGLLAKSSYSWVPPLTNAGRIWALRKWAGMGQVQFSKGLGITQGCLSKIEQGQFDLTLEQLLCLRKVTGITADEFLDGLINYPAVAKRCGNTEWKKSRFLIGAQLPIRSLFPLILHLESFFDEKQLMAYWKKTGFPTYFLAAPTLKVSSETFWDLVGEAQNSGVFDHSGPWEEFVKLVLSDRWGWGQSFTNYFKRPSAVSMAQALELFAKEYGECFEIKVARTKGHLLYAHFSLCPGIREQVDQRIVFLKRFSQKLLRELSKVVIDNPIAIEVVHVKEEQALFSYQMSFQETV